MTKFVAVIGSIALMLGCVWVVTSLGNASPEQDMAFLISIDFTNNGVAVKNAKCFRYGTLENNYVCDVFYTDARGDGNRSTVWTEKYEDGSWKYLGS